MDKELAILDKRSNDNRDAIIENTKGIALIQKDIGYIRSSVDNLIDAVKDLRVEIKTEFVSKSEHLKLKEEVDELIEFKDTVLNLVVKYSISSALATAAGVVAVLKFFNL